MSRPITRIDIAEIYEALGDTARGALMRDLDEPDPDALTADELADGIAEVVNAVPDTGRGKHDDECWMRHAPCLADRIRELLP